MGNVRELFVEVRDGTAAENEFGAFYLSWNPAGGKMQSVYC